jgi:hypothetical protein
MMITIKNIVVFVVVIVVVIRGQTLHCHLHVILSINTITATD